jgi:hypothetical protein
LDQPLADRFNALEETWVDPVVALAKSSLKVTSPKLQDESLASGMKAGLEISGQLITGLPGAVLKLVSVDERMVAILSRGGGEAATLLDVESKSSSSVESHRIGLPDGTSLHVSATSDASRLHLLRTSGEGTSVSSEFQKGEEGYDLTGFSLRSQADATIGANGINTDRPTTYVSQSDDIRSRSARTSGKGSELSSKPLYSDDYQAIESNLATLDELEAGARTVWTELGILKT